jgi:hypothetical protein
MSERLGKRTITAQTAKPAANGEIDARIELDLRMRQSAEGGLANQRACGLRHRRVT